jgi:hypothetical protein
MRASVREELAMRKSELRRAVLEVVADMPAEEVLGALVEVCHGKADHLRSNWQDPVSAKAWERAAGLLDRAGASGCSSREVCDELEQVIDRVTLPDVLFALARTWGYHAVHVRLEQRDREAARGWERMSEKVLRVWEQVEG